MGERLVVAWACWPEKRPTIPADEDEELHARRLVAQRCLYGVDKNPRAVDLARLSLWLATLARDHEFTFLDHALKCGDSLVGLTKDQISATHWDTTKPPTFVGKLVSDHLREAEKGRARIREQAEWASEAELRPQFEAVESQLEVARLIGDGIVAAFFSADKPKKRIEQLVAFQKLVQSNLGSRGWEEKAAWFSKDLLFGVYPIPPFHWQIEFPEVFSRRNPGFDAIIGNPPFAGKNTIIGGSPKSYLPWLQTLHEGAHGNSDLVAHFFRRAFGLLREGGEFCLIATNTIGQGDTRASGLTMIVADGGAIVRARRRLKWPGEASVVVSVVHIVKGEASSPVLDNRQVRRISAYLVEGDLDTSPSPLVANSGKAFQGSIVLGAGFIFDDLAAAKGEAESLATLHALIAKDPRNSERIFPYIGGEEVNTDPRHAHHRYVIDFADLPLRRDGEIKPWTAMTPRERDDALRDGIVPLDYSEPAASDWPDLLEIVDRLVKPERAKNPDRTRREIWWKHTRRVPALKKAMAKLDRILVNASKAAPQYVIGILPKGLVYSQNLNVFALESFASFTAMQSRSHEIWARFVGTTMKDDLTYTIEDCFRTYPFPEGFEMDLALEAAGCGYHTFRAQMMTERDEGLTKIYNRFHARNENAPDIARLRA
ncbi:MAG TPA: DNA methyltransferase, partial [Afipia sp.]